MSLVSLEYGDEVGHHLIAARRTLLTPLAAQWLHDSVPKQTFDAYSREWVKFLRWCEARDVQQVPVATDHLTNWIAERCTAGDSQSAIKQGISAVVFFHKNYYNVPDAQMPERDDAWRILAAYRRQLIDAGWRPDEAATYDIEQLRAMSATLPVDSPLTLRDRAGLLLATGAFARRSQLVGLDLRDLHFTKGRVVLYIAKSKEDQKARGRHIVIDPGSHELSDAVGNLKEWVKMLNSKFIHSGPVFRRMWKTSFGYKIQDNRLDPEWLGRVVKTAIEAAGIEAPSGRTYRGHSPRASGATMGFRAGKPSMMIADHGGWSRQGTQVHQYDRPEEKDSVTEGLM